MSKESCFQTSHRFISAAAIGAMGLIALLITQSAQAANSAEIYCMGNSPAIDLKASTISDSDLGIKNEKIKIVETRDQKGELVLVGTGKNIIVVSHPSTESGWSGDLNTTVTDLKSKKTIRTECNLEFPL